MGGSPGGTRRRKLSALLPFLAGIVTSSVAGELEGLIGGVLHPEDRPVPTIKQQLGAFNEARAREGLDLVSQKPVGLRASASDSYVSVYRPRRARSSDADLLVVYDQDDERRLRERFSFRPSAGKPAGGALLTRRSATQFVIPVKSLTALDFDRAPGRELVFGVSEIADGSAHFPRPMILAWDPTKGRYRLQALLSRRTTDPAGFRRAIRPRVSPRRFSYAASLLKLVYAQSTILRDPASKQAIPSFSTEVFRVLREPVDPYEVKIEGRLTLVAGYIVRDRGYGSADRVKLVAWSIAVKPNGGSIRATPVPLDTKPVGNNGSHLDRLLPSGP